MKQRFEKIYLLILGTPRSGTTLLTAMIGCHPSVAMLSEDFTGAVRKLVGKPVVGNKLCVPNQIDLFNRNRRLIGLLSRRGIPLHHIPSKLSINDYIRKFDARMIMTLRDPNAVVSSIIRRGENPLDVAVQRWADGIRILYKLKSDHPERVLIIRFNDLVSSTEHALRSACNHLGIVFYNQMMDGYIYTPIYNNNEIDASKAHIEIYNYDLQIRDPDAYEKYRRLRDVNQDQVSDLCD